MVSLLLSVVGSLMALGGLVSLLPQVRAQRLSSASIGAWVFRAGILVLLAGETVAIFVRPDSIAIKTMLILSAAIVFVCLAVFLREWRQPGFLLDRSFSWSAAALGMGALLMAMMYIEGILMLIIAALAVLGVRTFRSRANANQFDYAALQNLIIALQATIVVLTLIFLIL